MSGPTIAGPAKVFVNGVSLGVTAPAVFDLSGDESIKCEEVTITLENIVVFDERGKAVGVVPAQTTIHAVEPWAGPPDAPVIVEGEQK